MLNDRTYRYHYEILWHHGVAVDVAVEPISSAYSPVRVVNYAIERKTSTFYSWAIGLWVTMMIVWLLLLLLVYLWFLFACPVSKTPIPMSRLLTWSPIVVVVACVVHPFEYGLRVPMIFVVIHHSSHQYCPYYMDCDVFVVHSLYGFLFRMVFLDKFVLIFSPMVSIFFHNTCDIVCMWFY